MLWPSPGPTTITPSTQSKQAGWPLGYFSSSDCMWGVIGFSGSPPNVQSVAFVQVELSCRVKINRMAPVHIPLQKERERERRTTCSLLLPVVVVQGTFKWYTHRYTQWFEVRKLTEVGDKSRKEENTKELCYSFYEAYKERNRINHNEQLKFRLVSVESVSHLVLSSRWHNSTLTATDGKRPITRRKSERFLGLLRPFPNTRHLLWQRIALACMRLKIETLTIESTQREPDASVHPTSALRVFWNSGFPRGNQFQRGAGKRCLSAFMAQRHLGESFFISEDILRSPRTTLVTFNAPWCLNFFRHQF